MRQQHLACSHKSAFAAVSSGGQQAANRPMLDSPLQVFDIYYHQYKHDKYISHKIEVSLLRQK
jgi:hypothetical protein